MQAETPRGPLRARTSKGHVGESNLEEPETLNPTLRASLRVALTRYILHPKKH